MRKKNKDWRAFYLHGDAPEGPTDFCRFVLSLGLFGETAVDLGCGNCRDTRELSTRYATIGIDPAAVDLSAHAARASDSLDLIGAADLVYSRFWLHSVADAEIDAVLRAAPRHFAAESRVVGDEPKLYRDHDRHLTDGQALVRKAMAMGYRLIHYSEGRGMARYRDEDPLVCRIVLTRDEIWA
ncbi:MAG: class I SAM-dependent methyltransferase [Bacteroidales bacterium]|jgi:hypothetical protein|nr:class I SAM-dependent methyltransferase [Sphaerochaeta sp.]MCK9629313.1 class I SAM-dependent methyltransferase [Bacteroidales bacterium]